MSSSSDILNFYDKIPKKYQEGNGITYANYSKLKIKVPFRMLIVGSSGSGKTNIAMNLIRSMSCFTRIYLIAKNLEEPLYRYLIDSMTELGKKLKKEVIFYSNNIDAVPPCEMFDKKENNLIIFDDLVSESVKKQKAVSDIFIAGRKMNISSIYISQSYFATPSLIRKNVDYIIIKKINTSRDLTSIIREYNLSDTTPQELMKLYKSIITKEFTNFLLIDVNTNDPSLKYRENFIGINLPNCDNDDYEHALINKPVKIAKKQTTNAVKQHKTSVLKK